MTQFKTCDFKKDGIKCDTKIKPPFHKILAGWKGIGRNSTGVLKWKLCDYHLDMIKEDYPDGLRDLVEI